MYKARTPLVVNPTRSPSSEYHKVLLNSLVYIPFESCNSFYTIPFSHLNILKNP